MQLSQSLNDVKVSELLFFLLNNWQEWPFVEMWWFWHHKNYSPKDNTYLIFRFPILSWNLISISKHWTVTQKGWSTTDCITYLNFMVLVVSSEQLRKNPITIVHDTERSFQLACIWVRQPTVKVFKMFNQAIYTCYGHFISIKTKKVYPLTTVARCLFKDTIYFCNQLNCLI